MTTETTVRTTTTSVVATHTQQENALVETILAKRPDDCLKTVTQLRTFLGWKHESFLTRAVSAIEVKNFTILIDMMNYQTRLMRKYGSYKSIPANIRAKLA